MYSDYEFEVRGYLTNLGLYTEGELRGEWVTFPCDKEEFAEALDRIGVKEGVPGREEYFFTDWESDDLPIDAVIAYLGGNGAEYVDPDSVNLMLEKLEEAAKECRDRDAIIAVCEAFGVKDVVDSKSEILFVSGVHDDKALGEYFADVELLDIPLNCRPYFDYERYGRDIRLEEGGEYTKQGYIALL